MKKDKNTAIVIGTFWVFMPPEEIATTLPVDEDEIKRECIEHFANESIRMGLVDRK